MSAISLVIPAYNEAKYLPRLLDTVEEARRRFAGGPDSIEIIVADNASTDGTGELAAARGCRVAHVPERRIASARNGGARLARGGILCFVDADSRIHPETFNAIAAAMARDDVVAGATGVDLERWSPGIAATFAAFMPFVILSGMDSGVVFCRRGDFESIGGYDERREFAEDVAFLWAMRRLGRTRGQRLLRVTEVKAVTSTRKFDRYGDWHYFTQILPRCLPGLWNPAKRVDVAKRYWYGNDR